jgi:hypothetical protein
MTQNWRRVILGFVLVATALGASVLAHDDKGRDTRADKARDDKSRDPRDERDREPQFRITDYQLVKVERIDRHVRQFTYRARLRNRGPAIAGATAVLLERRQDIDIVDAELTFGPVDARSASRSLDTFSFRRRGENAHLGNLGESVRWDVRPFAGTGHPWPTPVMISRVRSARGPRSTAADRAIRMATRSRTGGPWCRGPRRAAPSWRTRKLHGPA